MYLTFIYKMRRSFTVHCKSLLGRKDLHVLYLMHNILAHVIFLQLTEGMVPFAGGVPGGSRYTRFIHGWPRIPSRRGRSSGSFVRHHSIRSCRSSDMDAPRVGKMTSALMMCSSVTNGMSPHTMLYSSVPRDHVVNSRAPYRSS